MDTVSQSMSISRPKVSVIVPVYNAQAYLQECLDSIFSQDYPNIEVIVVDDGSTDSSHSILMEYASKESRLKVLSIENQGVSVARNVALDNVTGDYLLMVDSDDVLRSGAVSALMSVAEHAQPDIVSFEYKKYYQNTTLEAEKLTDDQVAHISTETFFRKVFDAESQGYVGGYIWARMYKTSILRTVRFDKTLKYYEDEKFFAELLASLPRLKIVHFPQKLYFYRVRQSSLMKENRYLRLLILYRSLRVLKSLYPVGSVQYEILDKSRFKTLTKLVQSNLAQGKVGGLNLFRKILLSGKYNLSLRKKLPYLLGRGMAMRYSVKRLNKDKKVEVARLWP